MDNEVNVHPANKMLRPKAVIFDIGRVIVRLNVDRAFLPIAEAISRRDSSGKRLTAADTWKLIYTDERWQEWQEGRISPAEWHTHLMLRLNLSLSYREFHDAWNRVLDPETILSEDLFAQLSTRCRLALLSNTDPIHVEALERRFTFGRHFPIRIYSCSIGASKPSPYIYRAALEALGVSAREALYVDDVHGFVDAAKEMGMDGIRFENSNQLEAELRRRELV